MTAKKAAKKSEIIVPTKITDGAEGNVVLIDVTKFDKETKVWADEQAKDLDFLNTNDVMLFGADPQKKLSGFLDTLLADIKVKEAGAMGDLTIALSKGINVTRINEFQEQMKKGRSVWARLPLIGKYYDYAKIFLAKQGDFKTLVDNIEKEAQKRQDNLMRKNISLDALHGNTADNQDEMAKWIISGEIAREYGKKQIAELNDKVQESGDPIDTAAAHDFQEQLTQFEVRLSDMKTAYLRAMVSGPQIRTVQQSIKMEMNNITRSILNDLTALKGAIVMAAASYSVLQAQAERSDRKEALQKIEDANMEAMGKAYIAAKESQGDSLNDAVRIADIANNIVATLNKGVEIDKENVKKRAEAEQKLIEAKNSLKAGLEQIKELRNEEVAETAAA